jgi:hypothetical protein
MATKTPITIAAASDHRQNTVIPAADNSVGRSPSRFPERSLAPATSARIGKASICALPDMFQWSGSRLHAAVLDDARERCITPRATAFRSCSLWRQYLVHRPADKSQLREAIR